MCMSCAKVIELKISKNLKYKDLLKNEDANNIFEFQRFFYLTYTNKYYINFFSKSTTTNSNSL